MTRSPLIRALSGRTMRLLLMLLALVEAHYIADSLATLIETVVSNNGTLLDISLLLVLTSPQVIDFALPLAILIGLYFAIGAARDENELVACAAAGVPWTGIPVFAFRVGILGFLTSLLFAGFLTPIGNYTMRMAIHGMETRAVLARISSPTPGNEIRQVKNRTVIATPARSPSAERGNLFIFEPDTGFGWRVSQASDWSVVGPDESDAYAIRLKGFRDYREVRPDTEPEERDGLFQELGAARITVQSLAFEFRLDEVVQGLDRTPHGRERVLVSLAALTRIAGATIVDRRFGEVMARAILCVFAALTAVAASAWNGSRRARLLALPIAAVLVLGADVLARTLLGDAGASGGATFWASLVVAFMAAVALPMLFVASRGEALIAPGRGVA